eukprot:CAMPEP_0175711758 /NCGR_PEP_ID=MMETSP0097-20121207/40751_1 /TAXON_ID=311494 /ORGANISM="Alexandrium monilatum, Strain CCMP3105" /LENGTH=83 /DNA_ID=CAMNT_0017019195 /DNA_START=16 /DNA_END=264 /DNA_ORIENTATION=-
MDSSRRASRCTERLSFARLTRPMPTAAVATAAAPAQADGPAADAGGWAAEERSAGAAPVPAPKEPGTKPVLSERPATAPAASA